jgi:8-oxo-dGTP pyrophosphatase MutT (NUDIX family)
MRIIILPLFQSSLSHMSSSNPKGTNEDRRSECPLAHSQSQPTLYNEQRYERAYNKYNKIFNKMIYYGSNSSSNIFKRMHRASWRSGKFPDGSLDIKSSAITPKQTFRLTAQKTSGFDPKNNEERERLKCSFSEDEKTSRDQHSTYIEGRRCGIIPVDIRHVNGKNVVSFLTVLGKSSRDERNRMINIYSFAKGRMEPRESHEECASREFWEETGIKLKGIEALPRINIGKNIYFIFHTTKEALCGFSPVDRKEVEKVEWKTLDELKSIVSSSHLFPITANKDIRQVIRYPERVFPFHRTIYNRPSGTRDEPLFDMIPDVV